MYHYDDNSLNEVFKNKLVKFPLSSLPQPDNKSFQNYSNQRLHSSWAKQIPKCLDKVPGTSKDSNCDIRGDRQSFMMGTESPCHIKPQKCCDSMCNK